MNQIIDSLHNLRLVGVLGWNDVQQTYKRSKIGPFWISIGSAVGIVTVTLVYGLIFKANLSTFLPYITTSILSWNLMASIISESSLAYSSADSIIKQIKLPLPIHNWRVFWRNIAIAGHNFVMLPLVFIVTGFVPSITFLLFPLSLLLVLINLGWISILISLASTRFRDLGPSITNILQVAFYVTPVIWIASSIPGSIAHVLLGFNPLYHWLQLLRLPLLNQIPTVENFAVTVGLALIGWIATVPIFNKFNKKVSLWL